MGEGVGELIPQFLILVVGVDGEVAPELEIAILPIGIKPMSQVVIRAECRVGDSQHPLDVVNGKEDDWFAIGPIALDHREFKWEIVIIGSPVELGEGEIGIAMTISQGGNLEVVVEIGGDPSC